jgi:LmbE family N-acetylglucosaminyl deacetylase
MAPHPDDFDVIAVTLRFFHQRGDHVSVAVLTAGVSGVDDGFAGARTADDKAAIREAEQRASCTRFGLPPSDLVFLRLGDGPDGGRVRAELERASPDIVFLPHPNDSNPTHRRTHTLVTAALRELGMSPLLCLGEDPKTLGMRRDLLMPLTEADEEWKGELLRCHASQQARNLRTRGAGLDTRILEVNRAAALALGVAERSVEAFELLTTN